MPSGAKESLSAGMIAGMNTHGGISESVNKGGSGMEKGNRREKKSPRTP